MNGDDGDKGLTESVRKEIFLALVNAQDEAITVAQSRKEIAQRYHVTDKQVRQIEQEGLDNEWPPL